MIQKHIYWVYFILTYYILYEISDSALKLSIKLTNAYL